MLAFRNNGATAATGTASLTGVVGGVAVYEQRLLVSVEPGAMNQVQFDPFTPTASGVIEWRVVVEDEDPDMNEATARTRDVDRKFARRHSDDDDDDGDHRGEGDDDRQDAAESESVGEKDGHKKSGRSPTRWLDD